MIVYIVFLETFIYGILIEGEKPLSCILLSPQFMTTYLSRVSNHEIAGTSGVDVGAISFVLLSATVKMNSWLLNITDSSRHVNLMI